MWGEVRRRKVRLGIQKGKPHGVSCVVIGSRDVLSSLGDPKPCVE